MRGEPSTRLVRVRGTALPSFRYVPSGRNRLRGARCNRMREKPAARDGNPQGFARNVNRLPGHEERDAGPNALYGRTRHVGNRPNVLRRGSDAKALRGPLRAAQRAMRTRRPGRWEGAGRDERRTNAARARRRRPNYGEWPQSGPCQHAPSKRHPARSSRSCAAATKGEAPPTWISSRRGNSEGCGTEGAEPADAVDGNDGGEVAEPVHEAPAEATDATTERATGCTSRAQARGGPARSGNTDKGDAASRPQSGSPLRESPRRHADEHETRRQGPAKREADQAMAKARTRGRRPHAPRRPTTGWRMLAKGSRRNTNR